MTNDELTMLKERTKQAEALQRKIAKMEENVKYVEKLTACWFSYRCEGDINERLLGATTYDGFDTDLRDTVLGLLKARKAALAAEFAEV